MIITEVRVEGNNLSGYKPQLVHGDDLPVIAAYSRVSSELQSKENHSIQTQESVICETCYRKFPNGFHIVYVTDPGYSGVLTYRRRTGSKSGEYRPGLTMVADMAQAGLITHLVVFNCSRLSRSLEVWQDLQRNVLGPNKVTLISATEQVSNETPDGEFVTNILMASSEFVWEQIRQACVNGMRVRRDELYTLGEPPYGWTWGDKRGIRKGERIGIVHVPGQDAVIKKICGLYLSGMSIRGIARELSRQQIPAPRGGETWSKSPVKQILINFRNAGLVRIKTGELVPGRHYDQRIIDEHTYYLIQERLTHRKQEYEGIRINPKDPILHSRLRCALCGHSLNVRKTKSSNLRYFCRGRHSGREHSVFCANVDLVDSTIASAIQEYLGAGDFRKVVAEDVQTILTEQTEHLATLKKRLEDKLCKIKKDFIELARCHNRGNIVREHFNTRKKELEVERVAFEEQIIQVKARLDGSAKDAEKLQCALELIHRIPDLWESMTDKEKEELLSIVEYAFLEPKDMHVDLRLKLIVSIGTEK